MIETKELLKKLLVQKQSKKFYSEKLGVSEQEINRLLEEIRGKKTDNHPKVRILLLDIETSPLLAYVYQKQVWKAKVTHKHVLSNWFMLTWAAKWLNEEEVYSDALSPTEAKNEDDERIVTSLWILLDEADIIIAHNGDDFDIPNINTRCVLHSLPPPSPYKQIDTKRVAQRQFGFTHNSLDGLCEFFGIEGKVETDFQLWKDCIMGIPEALNEMEMYNKNDVVILEKIYHFLKPYIKGHPNLDLYIDSEFPVCTSCGKDSLNPIEGKYFYTQAVRYPIFRCSGCGAISRAKKGEPYINKKQISSIPR